MLIRVEAVQDAVSGNYYVAIYHPEDAPQPFVTTAPRYHSAAAAEHDAIAILAAGLNEADAAANSTPASQPSRKPGGA
ncbi:MAG: hypothetical protein H0W30_06515 [Gemmatimonadaceae bacterium]|nr:hypothetical protein [Gemmatimonadaceae bacterium]